MIPSSIEEGNKASSILEQNAQPTTKTEQAGAEAQDKKDHY